MMCGLFCMFECDQQNADYMASDFSSQKVMPKFTHYSYGLWFLSPERNLGAFLYIVSNLNR